MHYFVTVGTGRIQVGQSEYVTGDNCLFVTNQSLNVDPRDPYQCVKISKQICSVTGAINAPTLIFV